MIAAASLDRLILTEGSTAALLATRLGGLMLAAPIYASRAIPMRVRATMLVIFTVALLPSVEPLANAPAPIAFVTETGIGLAIGLVASFYIAATSAAGDLLAIQMGLSAATTLNPASGESLPVVGQFAQLTALTIVLALGGHILMIEAVRDSLVLAPLGGPVDAAEGLRAVAGLAGRIFWIALRFAAPIVAVLVVGNVVLGVLGRAVPQMNLLMVAFPVQIMVGLIALAAALPIIGTLLGGWPFDFEEDFLKVMAALVGG